MKNNSRRLFAVALVAALLLASMSCAIEANAEHSFVEVTFDGMQNFSEASKVLEIMNEERAAVGLAPLTADPVMMDYAMQRAAEVYLYYSHTRPDGTSCSTIFGDEYFYGSQGENIALGQQDAERVMDAWMNSEGHRANILNSDFNSVGIGCFYQPDGSIAWVQLFHSNTCEVGDSRTGAISANGVQVTALASNLVGHVQHHYFGDDTCAVYLYEGTTVSTEFCLVNPELPWYHPVYITSDNYAYTTDNSGVLSADNVAHTLTASYVGVAQLGVQIDGADINVMDDSGYINPTATVEVMPMPQLTYEIDDQGNIHVDYSGFNSVTTLFYKGSRDEMWTAGNRESDGIYDHYAPDPTETYVYVMRYWDAIIQEYVELGQRLTVQLGSGTADPDPAPDPDPEPDPGLDPVPGDLEIPDWDTEPTLEQVKAVIVQIQTAYPNGKDWTQYAYTWLGGEMDEFAGIYGSTGYDTMAFCMAASDWIFGDLPARMISKPTLDDLRIGDIVATKYYGEYLIVALSADYIIAANLVDDTVIYHLFPSDVLLDEMETHSALTRYTSGSPGPEAQTPGIIPENATITVWGEDIAGSGIAYSRVIKWALDAQGTLYVYGYGKLDNTTGGVSWQDYAGQVKRVVIGPNIFEVGRQNFQNFTGLEEVILGEDVSVIHGDAFRYCHELKTVHFPDCLTEIGPSAFEGAGFETLTLPDTIQILGERAFADCKDLASLALHTNIAEMGQYAFAGCTALTELKLPEGLNVLGQYAFQGCSSLKTVSLPGSLESIPVGAFYSCGLETVHIGLGTQVICESAFYLCTGLKQVHFPNTLTAIETYAFDHCDLLLDVYFYGTAEQWNAVELGNNNGFLGSFAWIHFEDPNQCFHTNEETVISTAPTCTQPGEMTYICRDCGETRTETIAATGHDMRETAAAVAPTCEANGTTAIFTCANGCGRTEGGEVIKATGHDYTSAVTEPTCTENGYTTYTCTVCSDSYMSDYVGVVDHSYSDGVCEYCGEPEPITYVLGDVNGDGKVNTTDAKLIMQYELGLVDAAKLNIAFADVNGDGKINTTDAKLIMQLELGIITAFGT